MTTKIIGNSQVLSVSGTVANANPLTNVYRIRLSTTTDTYVSIGSANVAVSSSNGFILPAHTTEQFNTEVSPVYISVAQVTTGGNVSITPIA